MSGYKKPLPMVNEDNREFWSGCKAHELRFQQCGNCGHTRWPASVICSNCHSMEATWVASSGKGSVLYLRRVPRRLPPGIQKGRPLRRRGRRFGGRAAHADQHRRLKPGTRSSATCPWKCPGKTSRRNSVCPSSSRGSSLMCCAILKMTL